MISLEQANFMWFLVCLFYMNQVLIDLIRTSYINYRREKYGKFYKGGEALEKMLPKAAEICERIKADPETYVKAMGQYCTIHGFPPAFLINKFAEQYYRKYIESTEIDPSRLFEVQAKYLYDSINAGRTVENTLSDDNINFDSWFRIIITKQPDSNIIALYGEEAKKSLSTKLKSFLINKGYDIDRIENYERYL